MEARSMAWRGASLLSSGTPRAEVPRSHAPADAPSFRAVPPPESHEAWMGTAYARWVERDLREKLARSHDQELVDLRRELEAERSRHAETAKRLEESQRELGAVPQLQARLARARKLTLDYAERGAEREVLGSSRALLRECFRAWSLSFFRGASGRAAFDARPDAAGSQSRPVRSPAAEVQQWRTLQKKMEAAFSDYAEAGGASGAPAGRAKGRSMPGYGLGATSAEEAALCCRSGADAAMVAAHEAAQREFEPPSPREVRDVSPAPITVSPWYLKMEDIGRPPVYGLPLPLPTERPPPSRGGLGLVFHSSVQRSVPAPSTGALLSDRHLRWMDLPDPSSTR